jgi:hypothetical protein
MLNLIVKYLILQLFINLKNLNILSPFYELRAIQTRIEQQGESPDKIRICSNKFREFGFINHNNVEKMLPFRN